MKFDHVGAGAHAYDPEPVHATFSDGAVVQVVSGDPAASDALAVPIDDAAISVTDRRIVAATSGAEWSWLIRDITRATHGREEPWTIFAVPGVDDHGVAVSLRDAELFRKWVDHVLRDSGVTVRLGAEGPAPAAPVGSPPMIDLSEQPAGLASAPQLDVKPPAPVEAVRLGEVAPSHAPIDTIETASVAPVARPTVSGLHARSISAWFGTHHVLDRVSLEMQAGEVTALIGPSGCGKSTFLRILNRMHEMIPSASLAGEVLLDGADIYDPQRRLTEARRQIGMVFQKPNPFPAMSIYDNVVASFKLTGAKLSKGAKDDVVETCLSKAGLWNEVRDRLRQPGGGLSGGQQQRLCIARALAIKPKVLLMDEPCSALDPTSTRRIEQTIIDLADEVTIVIVTHNMQQAARVSHRCAFFLAEQGTPGVIVEHGFTDAMFSNPQDPRTSDYVNGRFG